jgi:hypothetical protein
VYIPSTLSIGTTTTSGAINILGGNINLVTNCNGTLPSTVSGLTITQNYGVGQNEIDFFYVNTSFQGDSGGFSFYQLTSSTVAHPLCIFKDNTKYFYSQGTEAMRLNSSGNLSVGLTGGSAKINVLQTSNGQCINIGDSGQLDSTFYGVSQITRAVNPGDNKYHLSFIRSGSKVAGIGFLNNSNTFFVGNPNTSDTTGNGMLLTADATSWGSQSDERKKNIHGNIENAIEKISQWRTIYFNYKNDNLNYKQRIGLIAQDVEKTVPEIVDSIGDEENTLQVRYVEVVPLLVAGIKEQQTLITTLQTQVTQLQSQVAALTPAKV